MTTNVDRLIGLYKPKDGSKRLLRVLEGSALAAGLATQYTNLRGNYDGWKRNRGYTVYLSATDPAYITVIEAVLPLLPEEEQKYVSVHARRQSDGELKIFEGWSGTRIQSVLIDGHEIQVDIERPEKGGSANNSGEAELETFVASMKPDKLRFWSKTIEGKTAVLEFINRVVEEKRDKAPRLWAASRWGDWRDQSEVPHRTLASVVLKKGIVDDLRSDIESFLSQEQDYAKMGLPWHRGYLLHGPPGTGKTSLVRAMASELNLDLYAISLPGIRDDQTLTNLLSSVEARSAVLIEDIDIAVMARDRDNKQKEGVSSSGLLNALDGVGTPHGMLLFMTSNRKNKLDDALLRPGRCDRTFKIGYLDDEQLARMVRFYCGEAPELPPVPVKMPPAVVIECYKENLETPNKFLPSLVELLETYDPNA